MTTADKAVDVIVLGVGGMGSAACYHLADRGFEVLGLERYDIPHDRGSSHGTTRIIRLSQYEHPSYVPLVCAARDRWLDLERDQGRNLFYSVGSLDIGPPDGETVPGSLESCRRHGLDHEVLDGSEISRRYPGYDVPDGYRGVYQSDGGFLVPEQCIIAHVEAAYDCDADIRAREPVDSWTRTSTGVRVHTNRGVYDADRLVVTAGAWARNQLPGIAEYLTPERQVAAWFRTSDRAAFSPDSFPVFVMDTAEGHFYGFPEYDIPGFKFAKFGHREQVVDPDTMRREPDLADEAPLREFAAKFFPKGNGATVRLETCLFTHTPDQHFIIDRLDEDLVVACGFSGHGFKFASVVGEILTDLVESDRTRHDIDLFRLDRFQ